MAGENIPKDLMNAIGTESSPLENDIEKGAIKRFAEAIEDSNPIYTDESYAKKSNYRNVVAPPTFLRSVNTNPLPENIKSPYSAVVDGGSVWEYFEPVCAGDVITTRTKLQDIFDRDGRLGNMIFIIRVTSYTNQKSELVATQTTTSITYEPKEN